MNWSAAAAIISAVGLLITIGIGVFVSGKLTQKVDDNNRTLGEHGLRLNAVDGRLGDHDVSIGRLHEWKNGFNAGASRSGSSEIRD